MNGAVKITTADHGSGQLTGGAAGLLSGSVARTQFEAFRTGTR